MAYPSDLTQAEDQEIKHYLPDKKCTKPLKWTKHQIINGMMYVLVSGCQWQDMLPKVMPPWETVYYYFNTLEVIIINIPFCR